ncbi:hypothetical protein [Anabaena azotica]|uniref:hypothetical protein n=1 Tax=Anabaena azotica TaxID=197653 RepID=UPI0039A4D9F1
MTSRWRLAARAAIQKALSQLPENCDRAQMKKAIDSAYPFGMRKYWPYKIWLDERRHYFYQLGIPTRTKRSQRKKTWGEAWLCFPRSVKLV